MNLERNNIIVFDSEQRKGRNAVNLERNNIIVFDSEKRKSRIKSKHYRYPVRGIQPQLDKIDIGGHSRNLYPDQDYKQMVKKHKASSTLFNDIHFPASNGIMTQAMQGCGSTIEWLRPGEICKKMKYPSPKMDLHKRNRFDINQGEVGDCWFLAALAQLAEKGKCFNRIVPEGQGFENDYVGIFRFRFFRQVS